MQKFSNTSKHPILFEWYMKYRRNYS